MNRPEFELVKCHISGCSLPAGRDGLCGIHWLVGEFSSKWSLPILCSLEQESLRFLQLKRALNPISQRMLTRTLKQMEKSGLVSRSCSDGAVVQVAYGLTGSGKTLLAVIERFNTCMIEHSGVFAGTDCTE